MKKNKINRLLALFLLLNSVSAWALKDDFKQQIFIDADQAVMEQDKSVYTGNVIVTQGGMQLKSHRLEVFLVERYPDKVVATGSPVRMKQVIDPSKLERHGESDRAEYFLNKSLVILKGNAKVWLESSDAAGTRNTGDRMASDRIEYDYRNEVVKAGKKGQSSKPSRVRTVLQPRQ